MSEKLIYLISFILVLMLSVDASADDFFWDNGGDGPLWSLTDNWNPDGVPGSDDGAQINIPDANCLIDSSVNAACGFMYVGYSTGPCYLDMTGGTLSMGGHLRIGEPSSGEGVFNMSGGTVNTGNGRLWIGINGTGTLIMTGGEMTVADKLELGKNASGTGWLYIHGGTLNITGGESDDFEIAKYGTGNVYMTGGEINVTDNIKLGQSGGTGRIYLYGGTFNNGNDNPIISEDSVIDITEGTLVLPGDATSPINDHILNGLIKAYDGDGRVVVIYDNSADQTTVSAAMVDPELAWNPSPVNLTTVPWTTTGQTISWKPGEYAASHDVYFGTDWDDVNDADNTPVARPEYKGNQDPCSYDTGPLELGMTYYWRIDEVNDNAWAPTGSPWKGTVWEFTVADYLIVDDFEDYDAGDNQIWYTWHDGLGYGTPDTPPYFAGNGTGSAVGDETSPSYCEENIVHGGNQSVPLAYDNSIANNSEITVNPADLAIGPDWTIGSPKALSIWIYGDPNNAVTEQMYVKLNGVKVKYDGQPYDLMKTTWQEWNIDLAAFDVDLSSITELGIGFDRTGTAGGSGTILIDDIRLYRSRCIPSIRKPAGDLDNDCDVDYDDLSIMVNDWLETDYDAVGNDGILQNFPTDNSQWVNDPIRGRCLQFDGVDDWVDIDDSQMSNFHDKTISLWLNIRQFAEPYPYVFSFQNDGDTPYRIYIRTRGENAVRARFVEDYLPEFLTGTNVWHHLAFVIRDTIDGMCTGEFYGDGDLLGQLPRQPRHSGGAKGVNLGSFNDGSSGFLNAIYDEFRIYNSALSANEIKYLAGSAGGVEPTDDILLYYKFDEVSGFTAKNSSTYVFNRPLLSAAELYKNEAQGSRVVNFRDFAVLAEMWLEKQLWP